MMVKLNNNEKGFGIIEGLLIVAVVVLLGYVGYMIYENHNKTTSSATTANTATTTPAKTTTTVDPYAGWKTATSTRAKFSVKYPTNWTYSETVGDKDNVEHIVLDSSSFHITMDSFNGSDVSNGGNPDTKCNDCQKTTNTATFTAGKLGSVNLETITYTLDSGMGNGLVLRQADGTYYITSPTATGGIKTDFRGISKLNSLQDYQNETATQFAANPDLATAKLILKSVSY